MGRSAVLSHFLIIPIISLNKSFHSSWVHFPVAYRCHFPGKFLLKEDLHRLLSTEPLFCRFFLPEIDSVSNRWKARAFFDQNFSEQKIHKKKIKKQLIFISYLFSWCYKHFHNEPCEIKERQSGLLHLHTGYDDVENR